MKDKQYLEQFKTNFDWMRLDKEQLEKLESAVPFEK